MDASGSRVTPEPFGQQKQSRRGCSLFFPVVNMTSSGLSKISRMEAGTLSRYS